MKIFINEKKVVDCDPIKFYEMIEGARFDLDYTPIITDLFTKRVLGGTTGLGESGALVLPWMRRKLGYWGLEALPSA